MPPKIAGSSPVGHSPVSRIGKANPKNWDTAQCSREALLTPPRWGELPLKGLRSALGWGQREGKARVGRLMNAVRSTFGGGYV